MAPIKSTITFSREDEDLLLATMELTFKASSGSSR